MASIMSTAELPKAFHPSRPPSADHPLLEIAQRTVDPTTPVLISPDTLLVARSEYGRDLFIAKPTDPDSYSDWVKGELAKVSYSRKTRHEVATALGEIVEADILTAVDSSSLSDDDRNVLAYHLNPEKSIPVSVRPEIFTFDSAFDSLDSKWPVTRNVDDFSKLDAETQRKIVVDFFSLGLEVLEHEAENKYVKNTARRLRDLEEHARVALVPVADIHATLRGRNVSDARISHLAPCQHSTVYTPNFGRQDSHVKGEILLPVAWIAKARTEPYTALVHLLRVASYARDDHFGMLRGSEVVFSRELKQSGEIFHADISDKRANGLVATFLDEIKSYDHKVYKINPQYDDYSRAVAEQFKYGVPSYLFYNDPPERRSRTVDITP